MLSHICDLADATVDVSWAAARDAKIVNSLTHKHKYNILKSEQELSVQRRRKDMFDATLGGAWHSNLTRLQTRSEECGAELTSVNETVKRLRQELTIAEQKQRELTMKVQTYNEISLAAASKHKLLSIVADLRLYVIEQQKDRASSGLKLITRYGDFFSAIDKKIRLDHFESYLPHMFSNIVSKFLVVNHQRRVVLESLPHVHKPLDSSVQNDQIPVGIEAVNRGLRAGLEVLRLWRQLCYSSMDKDKHSKSLNKIEEFEGRLTDELNISQKMASDISGMQSTGLGAIKGSEVHGSYRNSTVFLYFNHLFHNTPDGHLESKRRMDTVVEKILKREKLQKAAVAAVSVAQSNWSGMGSYNGGFGNSNNLESSSVCREDEHGPACAIGGVADFSYTHRVKVVEPETITGVEHGACNERFGVYM